jgi:rubredoxin
MAIYRCYICNTFEYDSSKGDSKTGIKPGTEPEDFYEDWKCPICQADKTHLKVIDDKTSTQSKEKQTEVKKNLSYFRKSAQEKLRGLCSVNKVCDGNPDRLCMGLKYGEPIGFGGAGQGLTFDANFNALKKLKLIMRIVKKHKEPYYESYLFSKRLKMPVIVSSVSGVTISMNDAIPEQEFQENMLRGAESFGTIGLSGNTVDFPDHPGISVIKDMGGHGIPIFKPQKQDRLIELFGEAEGCNAVAVGVDLDGCGSKNWELRGKPVYRKSPEELKQLVDSTKLPVIFKGIMSLEDAEAAVSAGAKAIDVSNHGGRVMDCGQGVAEVLPEIARRFKGKVIIIADGAVRSGYDVLKLLALGADLVGVGRPMARMALSSKDAVRQYLEFIEKDLRAGMLMTGCDSLQDISERILAKPLERVKR